MSGPFGVPGHGVVRCRTCDTVVRQCRCMDHGKLVTWSTCNRCMGAAGPLPENAPAEGSTRARLPVYRLLACAADGIRDARSDLDRDHKQSAMASLRAARMHIDEALAMLEPKPAGPDSRR